MSEPYSPDLDDLIRMMRDTDQGPFMAAVTNLLGHIDEAHVMDENGNCAHNGCQSPYGEPEYSADWPCSWWLLAQRVPVAWMLERVTGVEPLEDRVREQARARQARRRQRQREGQESTGSQVTASRPEGTGEGLPEGLPLGLPSGSHGDSQSDRARDRMSRSQAP